MLRRRSRSKSRQAAVTQKASPDPRPGWYPDPANPAGQRYWDGREWTERSVGSLPVAGWYIHPESPDQQCYWNGRGWTDRTRSSSTEPATSLPAKASEPNWAKRQIANARERFRSKATPKAAAVAVAILVFAGGYVGASVVLGGNRGSCVASQSGEPVDCDASGAISEAEFNAQQERGAQASQAQEGKADRCRSHVGGFLTSLQRLDGRLTAGFEYAEYTHRLRDIRGLYDGLSYDQFGFTCLTTVILPAEAAMNSYTDADAIWHDCMVSPDCKPATVEPDVRRRWRDAAESIDDAQRGLRMLARGAPAAR
jgi:hypothetical protein